MERCLQQVEFGRALLFTDVEIADLPEGLERVAIAPLRSSQDYSRFVLHDLGDWIDTTHCLIVQWDGFILDAGAWDPAFLDLDYIGAPWPQFVDGHDVGNGGFSLRSKRLINACRAPGFVDSAEAEDVVIARRNRFWLEEKFGIRFADRETASRFSFERDRTTPQNFGFHGVFNLPEAIGSDSFWTIYTELDDRATLRPDSWPLFLTLLRGPKFMARCSRFILDRVRGV